MPQPAALCATRSRVGSTLIHGVEAVGSFFGDQEKLVELTESIEARTCRVHSQKFSQTFKETSPGNWVNVAEPSGPCGVVRLDRFQRVDPLKEGSLTFWNYYSEKRITTPDGLGVDAPIQCSSLDETPYEYVWQQQDHIMDCRYIKFGWF